MDEPQEYFLLSETASQFFDNGELKKEYSIHLDKCPVCEGATFKKLFKNDGFKYYSCKKCSFVFVNPRLNELGSQIWYNSQYYNAALSWEIYINKNKESYYSVSLNSKHFKKLIELISNNFVNKNLSIIDIGCSTGSVLFYLKKELNYVNLKGIDLNKEAVEFAKVVRDLDVVCEDITNIVNGDNLYDLVINTENIEHINSLSEYIKNISAILKINGRVIISTPFNDYKAVKFLGIFGDHFCAPNHINYFNDKNISQFLEVHGYEIDTIWLDEIYPINIFDCLKSKIYKPDTVIAFPPYHAFFSGPLSGSISKRKKRVRIEQISKHTIIDTAETYNSHSRGFTFLKKILKTPFKIMTHNHMILIAKKIR